MFVDDKRPRTVGALKETPRVWTLSQVARAAAAPRKLGGGWAGGEHGECEVDHEPPRGSHAYGNPQGLEGS